MSSNGDFLHTEAIINKRWVSANKRLPPLTRCYYLLLNSDWLMADQH